VLNLKWLLNNDSAFRFEIGEPGLATERRHQNDRNAVVLEALFDALKGFNTIHIGHHNIAQHQARRKVFKHPQALNAIARQHDFVTSVAQGNRQDTLEAEIIIDNKDCAFAC